MIRHDWRPGAGAWAFAVLPVLIVVALVIEDLSHPSALRITVQAVGFAGYSGLLLRALVWRITATPVGLRVRVGRGARTLPWAEVAAAVAVKGGSLKIIGSGHAHSVVIGYTAWRAPRRMAAEITALIGDPALRPIA